MFAWEMSHISNHIEALKATKKLFWHPLKAWTNRKHKQKQTRILRQILMGHLLQLTVDWHCSETYSMSRLVVDVQRIKTSGDSLVWLDGSGTSGHLAGECLITNQVLCTQFVVYATVCLHTSYSSFAIKPSSVLVWWWFSRLKVPTKQW